MQLNLNLALSERDRGIVRVTLNNATFIETMRGLLRMRCRTNGTGTVTADDAKQLADEHGLAPQHYNAYGAIFRCKDFEFVGMTISKQVQGHGNRIGIWRLRNNTKSGGKHEQK